MNTVVDDIPKETQPEAHSQHFDPARLRTLFDTDDPIKTETLADFMATQAGLLFLSMLLSGFSLERLIGIYATVNFAIVIGRLILSGRNTKCDSSETPDAIDRATTIMILTTGVVVPSLLALLFAIFHAPAALKIDFPGTISEFALLLAIPISILTSWYTIAKRRLAYATISGGAVGLALGLSAAFAATWIFQPPLSPEWGNDYFLGSFVLWAPVALFASCSVLAALLRVQNAKFRRVGSYAALAGVAASGLMTVVPHLNDFADDLKVNTAMKGTGEQSQQAIDSLRNSLSPEQLGYVFAKPGQDHRSGFGRVRLFDQGAVQSEPYFLLTGKSIQSYYSWPNSNGQDGYLGQQTVGEAIPGLTMTSSNLDGSLNPNTLTGSLDWTMVFRNATKNAAETRSEIQLPAGAVVSRVTAWINGKPVEATFDQTIKTTAAYQWVVQKHRDPLLVTYAGKDRIFVQAYPVPPFGGQLKLRVGIKTPLALTSSNRCDVALPRFSDKNFTTKAKESINLTATEPFIQSSWAKADQTNHLRGVLPISQKGESPITLALEHPHNTNLVATIDPSSHGKYIVQRVLAKKSAPVQKLVLVIDTSSTLKSCQSAIKKTLRSIPDRLQATVILATPTSGTENTELIPELSANEALEKIDKVSFVGGTNNDAAVLQGLESAGTAEGGMVFWLHGPQPLPSTFTELDSLGMFNRPRLVDLQLGSDRNEVIEGWQKSRLNSVACYDHVAMNDLASNLDEVIAGYAFGKEVPIVTQELVAQKPDLPISDSPLLAAELSSLWASKAVSGLIERGDSARAEQIGAAHHIISPVTSAVALERQSDYSFNGLEQSKFKAAQPTSSPNADQIAASGTSRVVSSTLTGTTAIATISSAGAPMLSGATNGSIGPQGGDATLVTGVNTCGTVRVNNLANVEALLNIIANGIEIIGLLYGTCAIIFAFMDKKKDSKKSLSWTARAVFALTIGLSTPGVINWLVASARDANLLS